MPLSIGVDLGLTNTVTLSNGSTIQGPLSLSQHLDKLAKANKFLQRKEKGSKNRHKAAQKVARLHSDIANVGQIPNILTHEQIPSSDRPAVVLERVIFAIGLWESTGASQSIPNVLGSGLSIANRHPIFGRRHKQAVNQFSNRKWV
jgi:hypothetical protein